MERKIWLAGVFALVAFNVFSQNNQELQGDNLHMRNRGVEEYKPNVSDELSSESKRYKLFARLRPEKNVGISSPAKPAETKDAEEKKKYFFRRQTKSDDRS